ncbi:MAG: hypothetical protein IKS96_05065 [Fibrobacter sp.]|nr:hypothetical protein [Fibrobacter sp.]
MSLQCGLLRHQDEVSNYFTVEMDQKHRDTDIEATWLGIVKSRKGY